MRWSRRRTPSSKPGISEEHLPRPLGNPRFSRGRRYRSISGAPRFMALYETETPRGTPVAWPIWSASLTRRRVRGSVMPRASATCAAACCAWPRRKAPRRRAALARRSFPDVADRPDTLRAVRALLPGIVGAPGICAAHLWLTAGLHADPFARSKAARRAGPLALRRSGHRGDRRSACWNTALAALQQQLPPATSAEIELSVRSARCRRADTHGQSPIRSVRARPSRRRGERCAAGNLPECAAC